MINQKNTQRKLCKLLVSLIFTAMEATAGGTALPDPTTEVTVANYNDMPVHDPSVVRADDGTFYVFGSHLSVAKTRDLMLWERVADGVNDANPLFDVYSTQIAEGTAWTGGYVGSWASDVIQLNDDRYYFYYNHCGSVADGLCNSSRSYIGVAAADSVEGPYENLGVFLRSGLTADEITAGLGPEGIEAYNGNIHPNAIDPDVFYDKEGKLWMVYGSYSGGIFILEMDQTTAMPIPGQGYGKHLTGGFFSAIEGPYILYSPESDYYYLFTSFGGYAAADGYNIRISRSRNPDGPFLDTNGNDMAGAAGGWGSIAPYGVKLMGGFNFASDIGDTVPARGYQAPGHNSAYYDAETGQHLLITHTRFPNRGEGHAIRVHEMFVNADGWLVASPHRYAPIEGDNIVDLFDLHGDYKMINHERDINRQPKGTTYITLTPGGRIFGEVNGYYRRYFKDPSRITITLEDLGTFEGITTWQWDIAAAKLVPVFTALSADGTALWGSKMDDLSTGEVLDNIAAELSLPAVVSSNSVNLPTEGTRGANIRWSTSDGEVINSDGTVLRPNVGEADSTVTLTATVRMRRHRVSRSFDVIVKARQPFNRTALFSFDDDLAETLGNFDSGTATGDRIFNAGSVSFTAGNSGQAVVLDGASGVLLPEGLISSDEYTVSFWINPTVITGFTTAFFGAVNEQVDAISGAPFSTNWISLLPQGWDGNTMFWSGNEASWFDGLTGTLIPAGEWSHVAFSVNKGLVQVLLNGQPVFTGGTLTDFFTDATGKFALGVNYWDLPLNGLVDELAIYDAALSAAELTALDIDKTPADQLLASAAALVNLGDTSEVREDMHLAVTGPYAAAIDWVSSAPSLVEIYGDTGIVHQPPAGAAPEEATLTATISLNGEEVVKEFVVTVKSAAIPDTVAEYRFESDLADTTSNFTAGTAVGPGLLEDVNAALTFVDGVEGTALNLNGSSAVKLPDGLITDNSYSVSMWLNPAELTQYTSAFFAYVSDTSWISVVPFGHDFVSGDSLVWSGLAWYDASFGLQLPIGEWSHMVMSVYDGQIKAYLNGEQVFSDVNFPDVFTPAVASGLPTQFAIGGNVFPDPMFNGQIDELLIFGEAMTADNAAELYGDKRRRRGRH